MPQRLVEILKKYVDEVHELYGSLLSDVTFEYNFDNDLVIMPIVKNLEHFNKWIRAYPFYHNVKKEGIELYAA